MQRDAWGQKKGRPRTALALNRVLFGTDTLYSPGEATAAQPNAAIQNAAVNPMDVSPPDINIPDPPTQSEVQQMLSRMNELISPQCRAP